MTEINQKKIQIRKEIQKTTPFPNSIMPKKNVSTAKNVYEKAEDLPEGRKKIYDSILEDLDKQVEARIEQINSAIGALQKQIKSQFKVALLQQSRATRQLKVEDFYYKDSEVVAEDGKTDLTVECAKLAVSISNNVSKEVKTTVKGQLISKCPFGVMVWTKIPTKKFDNFYPRI